MIIMDFLSSNKIKVYPTGNRAFVLNDQNEQVPNTVDVESKYNSEHQLTHSGGALGLVKKSFVQSDGTNLQIVIDGYRFDTTVADVKSLASYSASEKLYAYIATVARGTDDFVELIRADGSEGSNLDTGGSNSLFKGLGFSKTTQNQPGILVFDHGEVPDSSKLNVSTYQIGNDSAMNESTKPISKEFTTEKLKLNGALYHNDILTFLPYYYTDSSNKSCFSIDSPEDDYSIQIGERGFTIDLSVPGGTGTHNIAAFNENGIWFYDYTEFFEGVEFHNAVYCDEILRPYAGLDATGSQNQNSYIKAVNNIELLGTCSTAGSTQEKTVILPGFGLYEGSRISVKFAHANTKGNATLNVNSTGAKTIICNGGVTTAKSTSHPEVRNQSWGDGEIVDFMYDGNNWQIVGKPLVTYKSLCTDSFDVSSAIGGEYQPIYIDSSGEPVPLLTTVGGTKQPTYLHNGVIEAISGDEGSDIQPVYLNKGHITKIAGSKGSATKPIYLSSGVITESNATVGGVDKPVYLKQGEITQCNIESGSTVLPGLGTNNTIWYSTSGGNAIDITSWDDYSGSTVSVDYLRIGDYFIIGVREMQGVHDSRTRWIRLDMINILEKFGLDMSGHAFSITSINAQARCGNNILYYPSTYLAYHYDSSSPDRFVYIGEVSEGSNKKDAGFYAQIIGHVVTV